jgi:hypothetical protein
MKLPQLLYIQQLQQNGSQQKYIHSILMYLQRKGIRSGEQDGQIIGSPLLIHSLSTGNLESHSLHESSAESCLHINR